MPNDLTPDARAAHQFLTELRTRIATQPLPYQFGVEARALTSMWEVFALARTAMRDNPGCEKFADRATEVLNTVVRPLTAKWHRAFEEGRLNGRDGADDFRGELQSVQEELRAFAGELHVMAYGHEGEDELEPDVMTARDLKALFEPLAFGFRLANLADATTAKNIARDENRAVTVRRNKQSITTPAGTDAIGLALSGGGIRSASLALGVVQVLADRGFLKEVDFLSTVSGGGYTGSFLTRRLGASESQETVAKPNGPDPEPIRYARQNAKFLSAYNLKGKWGMVCATLAGMLLNWATPALVIVILALIGVGGKWRFHDFDETRQIVLQILAVFSVIATVVYGLGVRGGDRVSDWTGGILGVVLAVTGLVGASILLDRLFLGWPHRLAGLEKGFGGLGLTVGAAVTAAPAIIRFVPVLKNPKIRQIALQVIMWLAGLFVPLAAILVFYALLALGPESFQSLAFLAIALGVVSFFVVNINLTSPHRLYRDGLARTFIQKTEGKTPRVPLKDINPKWTAPYHILNATLNVPSSETAALKDRGCDFFMFSKRWIGSVVAGYHRTREWEANGKKVDLGTAMAVSGAAFSAHMGLGSMPTLTALLTLLNVRLGFWIKKPRTSGPQVPGFLCLLRETFGLGMTEKAKWLNLSDGGHIENMGIYELLRRRCKFIICVDGESDPTFTFQGLMTLVRHARIDFGINIEAALDDLRPDPKTGYSKSHFHFCRVKYPEGIGLLLYIKLAVTGNESELVRRYRINHPEFPHQTTLDQFFDQEQFEAYRQLGVHSAEGLFKPALMSGLTTPASVPVWFQQLAKNLLEPSPS